MKMSTVAPYSKEKLKKKFENAKKIVTKQFWLFLPKYVRENSINDPI